MEFARYVAFWKWNHRLRLTFFRLTSEGQLGCHYFQLHIFKKCSRLMSAESFKFLAIMIFKQRPNLEQLHQIDCWSQCTWNTATQPRQKATTPVTLWGSGAALSSCLRTCIHYWRSQSQQENPSFNQLTFKGTQTHFCRSRFPPLVPMWHWRFYVTLTLSDTRCQCLSSWLWFSGNLEVNDQWKKLNSAAACTLIFLPSSFFSLPLISSFYCTWNRLNNVRGRKDSRTCRRSFPPLLRDSSKLDAVKISATVFTEMLSQLECSGSSSTSNVLWNNASHHTHSCTGWKPRRKDIILPNNELLLCSYISPPRSFLPPELSQRPHRACELLQSIPAAFLNSGAPHWSHGDNYVRTVERRKNTDTLSFSSDIFFV